MTGLAEEPSRSQAPAYPASERTRRLWLIRRLLGRPELAAVGGLLFVFAFFVAVAGDSGLFSARGIINFLQVAAELGVLAAPVSLLMIAGEFDLSIGSMIGFAGIVIAVPAAQLGWPIWVCIALAFAVSLAVGYVNGLLVIKTRLPSFLVTLAALFMLRGLALGISRLIAGRTQVGGLKPLIEGDWLAAPFGGHVLTGAFRWLAARHWIDTLSDGSPSVPGLPIPIVWWIGLTLLGTWILLRTRFGNWIFGCGGDEQAARLVGVPVSRVKIILFMATAASATIYACLQVLTLGSADTLRGQQAEFEAIIAAVIGGNLLTGGYGSALGAALGAFIFGFVQMGIFYTGMNTDWFLVFLGAMVLIAVLCNNYIRLKVTGAR